MQDLLEISTVPKKDAVRIMSAIFNDEKKAEIMKSLMEDQITITHLILISSRYFFL